MKRLIRSFWQTRLARKWLPRNLPYYLKGGSSLVFNHTAGLLLGFFTTYVFTNYTSQQTYANFGYVLAVLSIASLAALPGVDTAVLYAAAKGYDGALPAGARLRLKTSLLGTAGMLLWAGFLYAVGRSSEAAVVAWCSPLVPLLYPFSSVFSYLQGKERFTEYTLANLAVEVAKTAAVAIVAIGLGLNGPPVILSLFLVMGLSHLLLTRAYSQGLGGDPGPEFASLGRTLTGVAVVGAVAGQLDRLIVGTFFSVSSMAAYNLGYTLTSPLRGFGVLAGRLLFPQIVRSDAAAPLFVRKYGLGLALLLVGLAGLVAAYWVLFPLVQPALFAGYEATIPMIRWLIVATALGIFDIVAAQALWGLKELRIVYITQTLFPIQRILLLALGGSLAGISGILISQVVHYSVSALVIIAFWIGKSRRRRPKG